MSRLRYKRNIILPVVLYGCETVSFSSRTLFHGVNIIIIIIIIIIGRCHSVVESSSTHRQRSYSK